MFRNLFFIFFSCRDSSRFASYISHAPLSYQSFQTFFHPSDSMANAHLSIKNISYFSFFSVLHVGRPLETLGAVCNRKDTINLILTNLHRIQGQVPGDILHPIEKKLNLPTFCKCCYPNSTLLRFIMFPYGVVCHSLLFFSLLSWVSF